jgi:hypothetical protein
MKEEQRKQTVLIPGRPLIMHRQSWPEQVMQSHDLDAFAAYSDAGIAGIAGFLHEQSETTSFLASGRDGNKHEEDAKSDDDGDDRTLLS